MAVASCAGVSPSTGACGCELTFDAAGITFAAADAFLV